MYDGLRNLEVPRRPRRKPRRMLRSVGLIGLVLMVAGGAGLFFTYQKVQANLKKGQDPRITALQSQLPDGALNILVLGSDRRDVIEGKAKEKRQFKGDVGQRADVMILLHIAPKAEQAVMVSLPRDLRVTIPGVGIDKLNAAYSYGGPNLTLKTVAAFTGIDINHYVEINFASFQEIVNAVGGVKMYIDTPLFDKRSGLNIPEPGCIKMNGSTALSYVRARYIDPTADIGRMQRQQLFIRTLLRKVRSVGFLLNPTRWIDLSEAVGNGVRYDKGVDLGLARAVANELAANEDQVDFRLVPSYSDLIGGISYLVPIQSEVDALFEAIRNDEELPDFGKTSASKPSAGDIDLQILNGSGKSGLASREQARLGKKGFTVLSVGNSDTTVRKTIIEYELGDQLMAKLVARSFPDSVTRLVNETAYDITVRLGQDHAYRVAMVEYERAVRKAERNGTPPPPSPTPPSSDPDTIPGAEVTPTKVDPEKKRCA